MADPIDLDAVMQEVLAAAREARDSGVYPPGLEEQLQSDFARQLDRPEPHDRIEHLRHKLNLLADAPVRRRSVPASSSVPGGSAAHKAIGKAVSRQLDAVYQEVDRYNEDVKGVLGSMVDSLEDPRSHVHTEILYELDALQDRVAELQVTIDSLGPTYRQAMAVMARLLEHLNHFDGVDARLAQLEEAERRRGFDPFFEYGRFEDVARGPEADIEAEYADLADRLATAPGPVVDVGAGRGELLRLLQARGAECWGVEVDEDLVRDAADAGLDIRHSDGLEALRDQPFGSLGGIVLLHVIEHLAPNELLELVTLAFDRLRPGGLLVLETPNPQSLYVFARAFWLDPTHSKPVHPVYLEFVLRQAGFDHVEYDWTAEPDDAERMVVPQDESPLGKAVAENAERLNALVFAAQNYRVIARR